MSSRSGRRIARLSGATPEPLRSPSHDRGEQQRDRRGHRGPARPCGTRHGHRGIGIRIPAALVWDRRGLRPDDRPVSPGTGSSRCPPPVIPRDRWHGPLPISCSWTGRADRESADAGPRASFEPAARGPSRLLLREPGPPLWPRSLSVSSCAFGKPARNSSKPTWNRWRLSTRRPASPLPCLRPSRTWRGTWRAGAMAAACWSWRTW